MLQKPNLSEVTRLSVLTHWAHVDQWELLFRKTALRISDGIIHILQPFWLLPSLLQFLKTPLFISYFY